MDPPLAGMTQAQVAGLAGWSTSAVEELAAQVRGPLAGSEIRADNNARLALVPDLSWS